MTTLTRPRPHPRCSYLVTPIATVAAAVALTLVASPALADVGTPVPLGAASTFAVLAGAGVTNTGATTLAGDVGTFPTTSVSGLGPITLVGGVNHGGDSVAQQAKTDLVTAYDAASAQTPDPLGAVELGGLTLEPGVYDTGGVIELNGTLTLDANGDPDAVFVFQSLSTLLAGAASTVTFIDGATACNLYWRVPTSATILAGSQFAGTILAEASISFAAAATLQGRALAQVGAVTLINNTITVPECSGTPSVVPPVEPEPTTTPPLPATPSVTDGASGTTGPPGAVRGRQVAVPPRGGVATGDGSSLARGGDVGPGIAALALAFLTTVAWVSTRPRRAGRAA